LILRECFPRKRRFEAFEASLGITRHVLADRLKKLMRRIPYQESPERYEYILTPKSLDLYPIIISIVDWGNIHMVDSRGRRHMFDPVMVCSVCGEWLGRRTALHTTACKGGVVPVLSLLVSSAAKARTDAREARSSDMASTWPATPASLVTDRRRPERGLRLDRRGQRARAPHAVTSKSRLRRRNPDRCRLR
jgi:DNA-binding HxlR family transcriptional regulator